MSDYLNNLLARELGRLESVEPRRPSRFEPPAASATFPVAAGRFGDDAPEPARPFRTGMTETSATETFADSPGPSPTDFSPSPSQHSDARHSSSEPRTPRSFEPEAGPHTRPPSSPFESRPSETLSLSESTHERPSHLDAEASDSRSPTPKLEPSPAPARTPPTKGTQTTANGRDAHVSSNVSPLTDDATSSTADRARSSKNPPSRFSPFGLETDVAGSAQPPRAAPPRETLHVPVLDAREVSGRPALARESDARATHQAETTGPRPSENTVRAESKAASAAAEQSRTNARLERLEGSDGESLEGRRARRQASQVEPRVTRRAESREAARRQRQSADARAEGASAPTVNVTIGRIEIRASAPAPRTRARREPSGGAPMSLEDYLRRRGGGGGGR